jgi:hypothetical protein
MMLSETKSSYVRAVVGYVTAARALYAAVDLSSTAWDDLFVNDGVELAHKRALYTMFAASVATAYDEYTLARAAADAAHAAHAAARKLGEHPLGNPAADGGPPRGGA